MKLPAGTITISGHVGQSRNVAPGSAPAFSATAGVPETPQRALARKTAGIQNRMRRLMIEALEHLTWLPSLILS
jgi:hypothetical protein